MRPIVRLRSAAETKGTVGGAPLVAVLIKNDVSNPVEPVLDSPVVLDPGFGLLELRIGHRQRADQVHHLHRPTLPLLSFSCSCCSWWS